MSVVPANASTFIGSPSQAIALRTAQAHELIVKVTSDLSDEQLRWAVRVVDSRGRRGGE